MSAQTKRLNVLIYGGPGAAKGSIEHATYTLRRVLEPHYAVIAINEDQVLNEPWASSCALFVMPGGADSGYCKILNGKGNQIIRQYVQLGGAYLGFCAGGYYGSGRCEFEVGKGPMQVVGDRELAFFPGICRGLAFPGFVYNSEKGARVVRLKVKAGAVSPDSSNISEIFHCYYNGGGVFVDVEKFRDQGLEVLSSYMDELQVEAGPAKAAVVFCKVGDGRVILTGVHPEVSGHRLDPAESSGDENYPKLVHTLIRDDKFRNQFMRACLVKLGLHLSQHDQTVPSLSPLHLSAANPSDVIAVLESWQRNNIIGEDGNGVECIEGENDLFHIKRQYNSGLHTEKNDGQDILKSQADSTNLNRLADSSQSPQHLVMHITSPPDSNDVPDFDHNAFFASLAEMKDRTLGTFGKWLLYGKVVTSTNSLLDKNPTLLSSLPAGFTATATTQIAGRGRGTNVWISPPGSLMFSTVIRQPVSLDSGASVIFVQHIAALAVVAGIQSYGHGYKKLPVKLKWPNDIYARDSKAETSDNPYAKIGGILVNSSYSGDAYTIVVGIGLNVNNTAPSLSLSQLAQEAGLEAFKIERLLASILTRFESIYDRFCRFGFDPVLEKSYYENWLHSDQIVTLDMEDGARARVKGITRDWGLLVVEELGWRDRPTGRRWELQSDGNSFDFFKGLLRRKA